MRWTVDGRLFWMRNGISPKKSEWKPRLKKSWVSHLFTQIKVSLTLLEKFSFVDSDTDYFWSVLLKTFLLISMGFMCKTFRSGNLAPNFENTLFHVSSICETVQCWNFAFSLLTSRVIDRLLPGLLRDFQKITNLRSKAHWRSPNFVIHTFASIHHGHRKKPHFDSFHFFSKN